MKNTPKVVCLNGNGIGQLCNVTRIPRKGETAIPRDLRYGSDSGKGVNNAIVIGRLGGDVAYVGKAGNDTGGKMNEKWLKDSGVNVDHFQLDDNLHTSEGLVLVADNGDNLIINFEYPESEITVEEAQEHIRSLGDAEYLLSGLEIDPEVAYSCCELGHSLGMKVFFNASPFDDPEEIPKMPYVDTLAVNETEAKRLLNTDYNTDVDWTAAARQLCEKYEVENVLITLGGDGAVFHGRRGDASVPGIPVRVIDESGAGDAFLAVFVQNLIWGKDVQSALEYANKYCAWFVSLPSQEGSIEKYMWLSQMDEILKQMEGKIV